MEKNVTNCFSLDNYKTISKLNSTGELFLEESFVR